MNPSARYRLIASGLNRPDQAEAKAALIGAAGIVEALKDSQDGAYLERNRVVAALARLFPSGTRRTVIDGWDEEWFGCVYIDLPTGQASWHYHDSQAGLFAGLPEYAGEWDGHDTPEKYQRVAELAARPLPEPPETP